MGRQRARPRVPAQQRPDHGQIEPVPPVLDGQRPAAKEARRGGRGRPAKKASGCGARSRRGSEARVGVSRALAESLLSRDPAARGAGAVLRRRGGRLGMVRRRLARTGADGGEVLCADERYLRQPHGGGENADMPVCRLFLHRRVTFFFFFLPCYVSVSPLSDLLDVEAF